MSSITERHQTFLVGAKIQLIKELATTVFNIHKDHAVQKTQALETKMRDPYFMNKLASIIHKNNFSE